MRTGTNNTIFSSTDGFHRIRILNKLRLSVVLFLVGTACLTPSESVRAYTFEKSIDRNQADNLVRRLRRTPSFDISDTYVFPARNPFLYFLFENLEVTGSLARASRTVNLHVVKRGEDSYSARTRHDLEGHCHRINLTEGQTRYVGRGTYRQDYVPFAIRGSALIDISWTPRKKRDGMLLKVRLRLIPANNLIEVIGTTLYPFLRLALSDVLDRIITVGRDFSRTVRSHPERVLSRLRLMEPDHAERWEQFLADHRMGKKAVLR